MNFEPCSFDPSKNQEHFFANFRCRSSTTKNWLLSFYFNDIDPSTTGTSSLQSQSKSSTIINNAKSIIDWMAFLALVVLAVISVQGTWNTYVTERTSWTVQRGRLMTSHPTLSLCFGLSGKTMSLYKNPHTDLGKNFKLTLISNSKSSSGRLPVQLGLGDNTLPGSNNEIITVDKSGQACYKISSKASNFTSLNRGYRTYTIEFNGDPSSRDSYYYYKGVDPAT